MGIDDELLMLFFAVFLILRSELDLSTAVTRKWVGESVEVIFCCLANEDILLWPPSTTEVLFPSYGKEVKEKYILKTMRVLRLFYYKSCQCVIGKL